MSVQNVVLVQSVDIKICWIQFDMLVASEESQGINSVFKIHPLGNMNACPQFIQQILRYFMLNHSGGPTKNSIHTAASMAINVQRLRGSVSLSQPQQEEMYSWISWYTVTNP